MSNCSFFCDVQKGSDENGKVGFSYNEYRFTFLYYLKVARKLILLGDDAFHVAQMDSLIETGHCNGIDDEFREAEAALAGEALFSRYGLDLSYEGFNASAELLCAELFVLQNLEKTLWRKLLSLFKGTSFGDGEPIWYFDSSRKHHEMMIHDTLSESRVMHYEKELSDFSVRPPMPYELETSFRYLYGGLINLAPVN